MTSPTSRKLRRALRLAGWQALLLTGNDFGGSSALTMALRQGWDPDKPPFAFPQRTDDGRIRLRLPSPQYHSLPPSAAARYRLRVHSTGFDLKSKALLSQASGWLIDTSYFAKWLHVKMGLPFYLSRNWALPCSGSPVCSAAIGAEFAQCTVQREAAGAEVVGVALHRRDLVEAAAGKQDDAVVLRLKAREGDPPVVIQQQMPA